MLVALLAIEIGTSCIIGTPLRFFAMQRLLPYQAIATTPDIHTFSWSEPQYAQNTDMSLSDELLATLKNDPAIRSITPLAITNGSADHLSEGFPVFVFFETPGTLVTQVQGGKSETVLLGSSLAHRLDIKAGHQLFIKNTAYSLDGILPESSSVFDGGAIVVLTSTSQLASVIHPSIALLSFSGGASFQKNKDDLSKKYTEISLYAPPSMWRERLPLLGIPLALLIVFAVILASLLVTRDIIRKKKNIIIQTAIGASARTIIRPYLRRWFSYSVCAILFSTIATLLVWPCMNTLLVTGRLIDLPLVLNPIALIAGATLLMVTTWLSARPLVSLALRRISFTTLRS